MRYRYVGQLDNICPLIDWKLAIDGISQFIGLPVVLMSPLFMNRILLSPSRSAQRTKLLGGSRNMSSQRRLTGHEPHG